MSELDHKLKEFNKFHSRWLVNKSKENGLGLLYGLVWCLRTSSSAELQIKIVKDLLPELIKYIYELDPDYLIPTLMRFKQKFSKYRTLEEIEYLSEDDFTSYSATFTLMDVSISIINLAYSLSLIQPFNLRIHNAISKLRAKLNLACLPIKSRPWLFFPAAIDIVPDLIRNEEIIYVNPYDFHYYLTFDLIENNLKDYDDYSMPDVIMAIKKIRENSEYNVFDRPEVFN